MSPTTELVGIVADAQKQVLTSLKEAADLSGRIFKSNLDLAGRVFAYQRSAIERFAGIEQKA